MEPVKANRTPRIAAPGVSLSRRLYRFFRSLRLTWLISDLEVRIDVEEFELEQLELYITGQRTQYLKTPSMDTEAKGRRKELGKLRTRLLAARTELQELQA